MSFEALFEQLHDIDVLSLKKLNYIYHYIGGNSDIDIIKKDGICSPYYLKNHYIDIFMKTSFKWYEKRAMTFLNKTNVNADDIIKYLDSVSNGLRNSKMIFFLFLPIKNYNINIQKGFYINNKIECKIPIANIKQYSPTIFIHGKVYRSSWKAVLSSSFLKSTILNDIKSKSGKFLFSNITHIGLENINNLPPNKFQITNI